MPTSISKVPVMTAYILTPRKRPLRPWTRLPLFILAVLTARFTSYNPVLGHGTNGHKAHGTPEKRLEVTFGGSDQYDYEPAPPGSYILPKIKKAGDGNVLDASGQSHQLQDVMKGKITVLAF